MRFWAKGFACFVNSYVRLCVPTEEEREKLAKKRLHIVKEVVSTEVSYVDTLGKTIEVCKSSIFSIFLL